MGLLPKVRDNADDDPELEIAWKTIMALDRLCFELKLVNGEVVAIDQFAVGRTPPPDAREILATLHPAVIKMMSGPEPLAGYIDVARRFETQGRWQ
jgi:hypothetical protein